MYIDCCNYHLSYSFSLLPYYFSRSTNNPNVANAKKVADLYAEVIGVLSQERFTSVRRRFFSELRSTHNSLSVIISVIEGLSFVRVIMYPTEELEGWFGFLQVRSSVRVSLCVYSTCMHLNLHFDNIIRKINLWYGFCHVGDVIGLIQWCSQ